MVIQANMPVSGVVMTWSTTEEVFRRHNVPTNTDQTIQDSVSGEYLDLLLKHLNDAIGSSIVTCIAGG